MCDIKIGKKKNLSVMAHMGAIFIRADAQGLTRLFDCNYREKSFCVFFLFKALFDFLVNGSYVGPNK